MDAADDAAGDAAVGRQDSEHQQHDHDANAADAADNAAAAAANNDDAYARSSQLNDESREQDKENSHDPTAGERVRPSRLPGDFARHFGLRPIKARQFAALGPDCDGSDGAYDFEWPETLNLPSLQIKVSELYDALPKLPSSVRTMDTDNLSRRLGMETHDEEQESLAGLSPSAQLDLQRAHRYVLTDLARLQIALIGYMLFDLQFARKRILALEERLEAAGGQVPRFDTSGVEIVDFTEDAVAARVNVTGQPGRIHRVDFLDALQPKEPAQPARREPLAAGKVSFSAQPSLSLRRASLTASLRTIAAVE